MNHTIKYRVSEAGKLLDKCPYGIKKHAKVGSIMCGVCEYYISGVYNLNIITCSYDNGSYLLDDSLFVI